MIKKSQLDKPLYRMKGIADMLNVHSRTVQLWCTVDDLKCTYVGNGKHGARIVSREDLIAYLCEQGLLLDDDNRYDAIYARVSTHKQKSKGDLDGQIALIKELPLSIALVVSYKSLGKTLKSIFRLNNATS